jgi:hypothetical protein
MGVSESDTKRCGSCGEGPAETGVNLTEFSCGNPCTRGPHNSAKCESLPSQIQNFTTQFFGEVVKTEVNGVVTWSLPCGLDVGLPANPRGIGEGLACYFLRLFNDGIVGLKGDKGATGAAGANGNNAYTVTLQPFTQPSSVSPFITLLTAFNPAISLVNSYVFIDTSGWYQITNSDGNGTLTLLLVQAIGGAPSSIAAGKLVVQTGPPGAGIKGDKGAQGDIGPQGPPGANPTSDNGQSANTAGMDYSLPASYGEVDFSSYKPNFLAPHAGTYLVTVMAEVFANPGVNVGDKLNLKLVNKNTATDIAGSIIGYGGNFVSGMVGPLTITALVSTSSDNQTISLYGQCTNAGQLLVLASFTTITWVRVA